MITLSAIGLEVILIPTYLVTVGETKYDKLLNLRIQKS